MNGEWEEKKKEWKMRDRGKEARWRDRRNGDGGRKETKERTEEKRYVGKATERKEGRK